VVGALGYQTGRFNVLVKSLLRISPLKRAEQFSFAVTTRFIAWLIKAKSNTAENNNFLFVSFARHYGYQIKIWQNI
jgi:hypothetical protein